ncbi:alpha/beta hydrolase [Neobacillus endophyticus]|uniref:alpha/beta hydrolase n=1 Tax=Neobacillus endophyticus TaxID=2738405 RepID=UPI0035E41EC3
MDKLKIGKFLHYKGNYILFSIVLIALIGSGFYFSHHTSGQVQIPKHVSLKYGPDSKQSLDLYAPAVNRSKKLPVIIYVHGGGWSGGDKSNVAEKPAFFTNNGYVFISINHRLSPKVSYVDMADDVAESVKWVYDNAAKYQIDRRKLNLMGHSSGGHLVMLIGTNPAYLNRVGLSPQSINSIISLEGPLDLTAFIQRMGSYKKVFGNDQKVWAEASPVTYASNKKLPPMFLVAHGNGSIASFVDQAKGSGNTIESFSVQTLTHSGVTAVLGASNASDEAKKMTNAVSAFLKKYNP